MREFKFELRIKQIRMAAGVVFIKEHYPCFQHRSYGCLYPTEYEYVYAFTNESDGLWLCDALEWNYADNGGGNLIAQLWYEVNDTLVKTEHFGNRVFYPGTGASLSLPGAFSGLALPNGEKVCRYELRFYSDTEIVPEDITVTLSKK